MFLRAFNKAWELERAKIEKDLVERLEKEISSVGRSYEAATPSSEHRQTLGKLKSELVLRKALAIYESEEIARARMQLRSSYLAVLMSSVALLISIITVLSKL